MIVEKKGKTNKVTQGKEVWTLGIARSCDSGRDRKGHSGRKRGEKKRGTTMGIVREGSTVSKRKPKGSGSKKRRKENIKEGERNKQ